MSLCWENDSETPPEWRRTTGGQWFIVDDEVSDPPRRVYSGHCERTAAELVEWERRRRLREKGL